jgi:hypothetical protein
MDRSPKKRTEINAVHPDDLRAFLERLGAAQSIARGELSCVICDSPLDEDCVGAVRRRGEAVAFVCSRPECIREFS